VALTDDLARIGAAAAQFASPGERVTGILAAQPLASGRVYLCAYESDSGRSWLAFDDEARRVSDGELVRRAASLAALCEVAEESAGGGDVAQLRAQLAELRETEAPPGIEEAEEAAEALAATLQREPRLATADYLDRLGAASRRLEHALGGDTASPFAAAMQQALAAVDELTADVVRNYKEPLA
jgi:hypothetical protein